jgi:hypothetical protein
VPFGYKPITVAVVEVRYALQQLTDKGYVSLADSEALVQAIKELPFTERSLDVILKLVRDHLNEEISEALHHALRSDSVKKSDASLALQFASSFNLT